MKPEGATAMYLSTQPPPATPSTTEAATRLGYGFRCPIARECPDKTFGHCDGNGSKRLCQYWISLGKPMPISC